MAMSVFLASANKVPITSVLGIITARNEKLCNASDEKLFMYSKLAESKPACASSGFSGSFIEFINPTGLNA